MKHKGSDSLKGFLISSVVIIIGLGFVVQSAYATNGYFAHGRILRSTSSAGAATLGSAKPRQCSKTLNRGHGGDSVLSSGDNGSEE